MNKITTTYGEFYKTITDNPGKDFYVKTHRGDFTKIHAAVEKKTDMLDIVFSDSTSLSCSTEHAFMGNDGDAVLAKDLVINSRVLSINGKLIVKSIKVSKLDTAYDIAIDAPHWYINEESTGIIHHNTSYALLMAAAYLKKHQDGMLIFYDSEFATNSDTMTAFGIDSGRVLHIPIMNIEEFKFDVMKKLDSNNDDGIKRGDKVFILVDSIGNLASVREANNAIEENQAQDMSRARELKSVWRMITPHLLSKNIPMVIINHVYEEQKMYGKKIISGGQGGLLSSDTCWILGRSEEKDGKELLGYNFTINVEKSRYVKEKSKIPILVKFDGGISKYTGILDMAVESGEVIKPSNGWYNLVDVSTGELIGGKVRAKDTECDEFLGVVLKKESFKSWVREKYKISQSTIIQEDTDTQDDDSELDD